MIISFLLGKFPEFLQLCHVVNLFSDLCRNVILFCTVLVVVYTSINSVLGYRFIHIPWLLLLIYFSVIAILTRVWWNYCAFYLHSLEIWMFSCVYWPFGFHSKKCLLTSLANFLTGLFCCCWVSLAICRFWILILYPLHSLQFSPHSVSCLFILLSVFHALQKLLGLMLLPFSIFLFHCLFVEFSSPLSWKISPIVLLL